MSAGGDDQGRKEPFNNDLEEDQPTMRAVALGSLQQPSLRHDGPSMLTGKPSVGGWKSIPRPDLKKRKQSLSMQQEWSEEIQVPVAWNVKPENLEMVPQDFPLERTNREIHDCDASEVASRITKALKQLSICAEFDAKNARAKCQTQDFVSFRIRLYAGGISGEPVIVEVQRRSGDARGFMQSCRSILSAAEGECVADQRKTHQPPGKSAMLKRPMDLKCLEGAKVHTDYIQCAEDALGKVVELMRKDKKDQVVMALENLIALTDPIKSAPKSAVYAAKCLVLQESGNKFASLRQDLGSVFVKASQARRDSAEQSQDLDALARSLCLKALSNALTLTSSQYSTVLNDAVDRDPWFVQVLLPLLVEEVKDAAANLNNAYVATCCLYSLCCSAVVVDVLQTSSDVLQKAHETGAELHELLEREAGRCLDRILG